GSNSLHQAAISADGIDVVIENLKAGLVITPCKPLLRDGHSHARRNSLPQRTGSCLNPGDPMILGMSWSFAFELPEMTNVIQSDRGMTEPFVISIDRLCAGEMKGRPEQHRRVSVRKHEPIAVGPDRIFRIKPHNAIPDGVNQRGERHRCAGVPGLGLLYRIYRQGANRVDRQLNRLFVCHDFLLNFHRVFSRSIEATLSRRRRWRSAWLKLAARKVSTRSQATAGPTVLPPIQIMFM